MWIVNGGIPKTLTTGVGCLRGRDCAGAPRLLKSPWLPTGAVAYRSFDTKPESQAIRSVIRMIATTLPSLNACSFVSLLQVQQKFFFAVKVLPS